jgi:large subunit ribosomal protein L23
MAKTKESQKPAAGLHDYQVIRGPVITEKASTVGKVNGGGVVFKVDMKATKTEIKEAIERIFKVEVEAVRTTSYLGKMKRTNRSVGRRKNFKKAYVTLKEGQSIDLVEGL